MKQNKAYKILEFDKILDKLSDYTLSEATKTKIKELQYYTKYNEIFVLSLLILATNLLAQTFFHHIAEKKESKNK